MEEKRGTAFQLAHVERENSCNTSLSSHGNSEITFVLVHIQHAATEGGGGAQEYKIGAVKTKRKGE